MRRRSRLGSGTVLSDGAISAIAGALVYVVSAINFVLYARALPRGNSLAFHICLEIQPVLARQHAVRKSELPQSQGRGPRRAHPCRRACTHAQPVYSRRCGIRPLRSAAAQAVSRSQSHWPMQPEARGASLTCSVAGYGTNRSAFDAAKCNERESRPASSSPPSAAQEQPVPQGYRTDHHGDLRSCLGFRWRSCASGDSKPPASGRADRSWRRARSSRPSRFRSSPVFRSLRLEDEHRSEYRKTVRWFVASAVVLLVGLLIAVVVLAHTP